MMKNNENFKSVSREEFLSFVNSYPRSLKWDKCGISEPCFISANDFTLGKWPKSIVASHHEGRDNYKIMINDS